GRGLPIGNLTSQWFANFYLTGLDHFAKETLKAPGYIRYMDDIVLFADGKAEIWRLHDGVCEWVEREGIWAGGEGADSGSNRVKRGGSWNNTASNCRSAYRNNNDPSNRNNNIGFRLVSTMRPKGQAGSHPPPPAPRSGGDEQARLRAAGSPAA
ncbi:MAG TPA: SUMF1/EgtB/PvdO family nonheme iron enzyme, partial [Kiritimatiellia bacterium]|nr:SUMF1/EgtB/PvdO family nonheme iron enzyme [Kiritimatiellia bacterium]